MQQEKTANDALIDIKAGVSTALLPTIEHKVSPAHESDFDRHRHECAVQAPQVQASGWCAEAQRYLSAFESVKKDVDLLEWWFVSCDPKHSLYDADTVFIGKLS